MVENRSLRIHISQRAENFSVVTKKAMLFNVYKNFKEVFVIQNVTNALVKKS